MRRIVARIVPLMVLFAAAVAAAGELPLVSAVKAGDHTALRTLVRQADVNAVEPDGSTALHWAVLQNDAEATDLLLQRGANTAAANRYGVTPLVVAVTNGSASIVGRLLEAGADANTTVAGGETVLMIAARNGKPDVIKMLLARGAKIDARENRREQNALMWAAAEGNVEAITALVRAGADLHAKSKAVAPRRRPATYDDPNPVDPNAPPTVPPLINRGNGGVLNQLANPTAFTPLLFAVRNGHTEAARTLLDLGATADERAADGTSALILAIANAHWDTAALLLDRGADPNGVVRGFTPLHEAVVTRRLNQGHLPHPVPTGRMTSVELIRKLIGKGADVNAKMIAPTMGDGYRNRFNRIGATPFLLAAKNADVEMMRLLLELHADPAIANVERTTPLHVAAGVGLFNPNEDAGTEEEALAAVKLMLELGADVNALDANGETALHGAAYKGFNSVAQLLIDKGARLDVKNSIGWTPYTIASGVMYTDFQKSQRQTADLLAKIMKERGIVIDDGVDTTGNGYVKPVTADRDITKAPPSATPRR